MKHLIVVIVAAIALGAAASAQTQTGRIQGKLASARGPLPDVEVRIQNDASRDVTVVHTARDGGFSAAVGPGTYGVYASPTGYAMFVRRQVVVAAGTTVHVDGVLADNPNAGTPGEIFFLYSRENRTAPAGPAPRMADGKPDLSGMWLPGADLFPETPPLQPWADAKFKENASRLGDDPRAQCLPSGVVRTSMLDLAKFVHTPRLLVMVIEGSVPGVRQIFLDGRKHPGDLDPTWLGHSIGTWDRDTLVIDTIGFNDKGWIDNAGHPQTERLHVVERYRRPDLGHLELEITIDDPGAYTKPWKMRRSLMLAPDEEIREYICNENHHTEHFRPENE
ncbi:MAG TPA: carboxypeptidase-like regulatory domain-containing protein [Vicinamibacterales bacterium]